MAGSKTRFGFRGNGDEPPDSGDHGVARTMIGHDIHLPKLPSGFEAPRSLGSPTPIPPAGVPVAPLLHSAVRAPMPEVITDSVPVRRAYRPQRSRLARFLGRWTASGHFQSRSRMGDATRLDDPDDNDLKLPRDSTGRNALLILVIAALTFLFTFAIVRLRQRHAGAPPVPGMQGQKTQAAPPPLPEKPAPITPAPVQPTTPPEEPLQMGTPPTAMPPSDHALTLPPSPARPATVPTRTVGLAPKNTPHPSKTARAGTSAVELPEHLKGELLPLGK